MAEEKLRVYSDAEIPAKIAEHGLAGWYLEDGWLRRKYTTAGWPVTLMLVNAIGYLAEAAWHHPDLSVTWGKVWHVVEDRVARQHSLRVVAPGEAGEVRVA